MNQSPSLPSRTRTVPLAVVTMLMLALYAGLAWNYRLPAVGNQLRANIGSLTKQPWIALSWLSLVGNSLYALYIAGALLCWRLRPSRRVIALVWGGAILAGVVLVFIYPVTSTDIFDYLFRGRIAAYYGKNPYIDLPNQFKQDPLFATVGWPNAPSAYGPLWEQLSRALAMIGGSNLWLNVVLHKAVALATYLACGIAIWGITRPAGRQVQLSGSFLWLWSPLTLWETVGAGHNDGLLVLPVLLAIWAAERGRIRWAVVALTVGTLLKFLPAILLPLVVVYGMRALPTWRERARLLIESLLLFAVITVAAYWPYWVGSATLRNIQVRENFVTSAPLAVLSYFLRQPPQLRWINDLLITLHLPHPADSSDVIAGVSRTGSALLGLGMLWQLWQIWRNGRGMWRATFALFLWYLTLANQWFQPWYVLWLLGLLALRPSLATFGWITAWSIAGQSSYLLQYFLQPMLRKSLGWSGQSVQVQSLYCIMIFIPPLVVWAITALLRRRQAGQPQHPGPHHEPEFTRENRDSTGIEPALSRPVAREELG